MVFGKSTLRLPSVSLGARCPPHVGLSPCRLAFPLDCSVGASYSYIAADERFDS